MAIRICSLSVPRFMHGGLEVGDSWTPVENLTEKQRAALRDFHGRFIQVHPKDHAELEKIGLRFVDVSEKLAEIGDEEPGSEPDKKPTKTAGNPKSTAKHAGNGEKKEG